MTTTNRSATATVEVLTAEVRVLMVGSRQITLSVYRQLDYAEPADLEPFGRVRSNKELAERHLELVGARGGVLVRSSISPPSWQAGGSDAFDHWIYHKKGRAVPQWYNMARHGSHIQRWQAEPPRCDAPRFDGPFPGSQSPDLGMYHWLYAEHEHRRVLGDFCGMEQLHAEWKSHQADQLATLIPAQDLYDRMAALPLIVLAGLR